eukprot:RCo015823
MKCTVLLAGIMVLLGATTAAPVVKSVIQSGTIVPSVKVVEGRQSNALAWGSYDDDTIQTEGWGRLYVTTELGTNEGWWAAGFLEGSLTSHRIYQHYISWYDMKYPNGSSPSQAVWKFIQDQYEWAASQAEEHSAKGCNYWTQVARILSFTNGMAAGQAFFAPEKEALSWLEVLLLQARGDLSDIEDAVNPSMLVDWDSLSEEDHLIEWHKRVSCSVLWKVNDALTDVLVAHNSWNGYQTMLRIMKYHDFAGHPNASAPNQTVGHYKAVLCSYPGEVQSHDDFYTLPLPHQQLVVTETTNSIFNQSLYASVSAKSLLAWQSVLISNALARSSAEWTQIFAKHCSGTYANQWMVGDMKLFTPGEGAQPGFLHIIEVLPGYSHFEDVTSVMVAQGNYWPSYNLPYFEDISQLSGSNRSCSKRGPSYCYKTCPRAEIFRRDHHTVQTMSEMKRMIRYNNWQNDSLSQGDPSKAISSRYDLRPYPKKNRAFGAKDAKASSWEMVVQQDGAMVVVNGPTTDQQPPFRWSQYPNLIHPGQPEVFDFDWVRFDFNSSLSDAREM